MKKSSVVWAVIAAALIVGVGVRIAKVKNAAKAPEERAAQSALVRVARVARADVAERISVTGTVRPRNEVDLYAKVPGRIESLQAQVGDKVKAGQLLAVIEHKEIAWQAKASQAALQVARANLDGARLEFGRVQALFKGGAAPQAQLDGAKVRLALAEAQTAQAEAAAGLASQNVENARVESPISGTITRRPVNVGAQVGPQTALFTVQDVAALKLEVSVDAASFARLAKGREALVTVDALTGQTFSGKVAVMSPSLDGVTRRAALELEIDNASGKLMPNMFAHADIAVGDLQAALVVPREAVLEAAGGARVYRVRDGKVSSVKPRLGPVDGNRVVVLEGLAEGDQVAVTGVANLTDGAEIRVAPDEGAQAMNTEAR